MAEEIQWAVKNGDLDQVKTIVGKGTISVDHTFNAGRRLLHYAADYGQVHILDYLISQGAEVNVKDSYGITPLLAAVFENHIKCVESLINSGADTKDQYEGKSYYDYAESDDIQKLLPK